MLVHLLHASCGESVKNRLGCSSECTFQLTCRATIVARPFKFETSDRFTYMIHRWKAKNLLFPTMCCNINLVKSFRNYMLLNTRSTAKNLRSQSGTFPQSVLFLQIRENLLIGRAIFQNYFWSKL